MAVETVSPEPSPFEEYVALMQELLGDRRRAGGALSDIEESRRTEKLDRVWYRMSDAEHDEMWRLFTDPIWREAAER